jgi:hypothetical protein
MAKLTYLLAAALVAANAASAQTTWSIGLRGGANYATSTLQDGGRSGGSYPYNYSSDKSALYAWQGGIVLEARRGNLAFQPALIFSQKGEKLQTAATISGVAGTTYSRTTSTNRYNWLELPLNVVYTPFDNHGFQVFAGPYAAVAVGGRQRGTTTDYSLRGWESYPNTTNFNTPAKYGTGTPNQRFDAGFNVGVGYRQGQLQVQLGYGIGLVNLRSTREQPSSFHNFDADVAHNRVAQLTATYFMAH